ncbi:protein VASCULAR ASSOCIATED DEATH 1, chloroplastic-like isoform X2 [Magnolia sinica]|uniref:protein VASCULAR ASSOCIATED DEATH 1, chloroplastic-like isoform X2 n=1 Tax=Magnolia sinica TaxID=86752 RepID=UPI00265B2EB7|nr:protein VASCULAR ASSOCIATED DEATH 1, chloroplastic-like isoform X2 [Magnolia sinica]
MEPSPSSAAKTDPADAASDTASVGNPSEQSDLSIHSRRDVDVHSPASLRSEEYRHLFHLPPEEGHMYLFIHHICFYSNIFGFETKKTISFHEVTCVRRAKTAGIFPNAIEILTGEKKHFFASFLSRDEAYRLIIDGWSQHSASDRQESKSDTNGQDNVIFQSLKWTTNDLESVGRNKDALISEESKLLSNNEEDAGVSLKRLKVLENGEEKNTECSPCPEPAIWKLEDVDAPKIHAHYTMVAESKFQIRTEEFFSLFFSDEAVDFVETFHRKCGDKDFRCTKWYEHEQFGHARDVSFQHPIKIYFGAKFGHCQEVQKFRAYRNSHLVIETSQEINDVPYGDYFRVEGLWDVEQEGNEENCCCVLRVYVNVAFSRKTMWKGKIEQSTIEECREAYALWISNAHESLKQKQNLPKLEGSASDSTNRLHDNDADLSGSTQIEGPSEKFPDRIDSSIQQRSDSKDVIRQFGNPVKGDLNTSYLASLLRESWAEFCSFLKSQTHFPLMFLIAFVSILVLTQLCIIVLLTRPPKVHLISEESFIRSLGSDRTETIAWLEKCFNHLKDEMLMVETRLENMRHEYALLQSYIRGIEQSKSKS